MLRSAALDQSKSLREDNQEPTHWNFQFAASNNAVSILLKGREVLAISYFPQNFRSAICDSYASEPASGFTEEQINHAQTKIEELGGPPTKREALKVLKGAFELNARDYAEAVVSHIESNLLELVTQAVDMIIEEAKQNSGREVDLRRSRKPSSVPSPRLREKVLNRQWPGIRRRSGATGGRPSEQKEFLHRLREVADQLRRSGETVTQEKASEKLNISVRRLQERTRGGLWASIKNPNRISEMN